MVSGFGLEIGYYSESGSGRDLNEDSFLILTPPAVAPGIEALLAIADGMGGHQAGDVASQFVVEKLNDLFTSSEYQNYVVYNPNRPDYYMVVLKEVLERINRQLCDLSIKYSELKGMGTTATVVILARGKISWGHVGDSRAYLLRRNSIRRLTKDHTWVAKQVEEGKLTFKEAMHHPWRNVLTQSMGNNLVIEVERGIELIKPGDTLLLCSDGLTSVVDDTKIQEILLTSANSQTACERLVDLARKRGGLDDITVIVARVLNGNAKNNIPGGRVIGPIERKSRAQFSASNRLTPQGSAVSISLLAKIALTLLVVLVILIAIKLLLGAIL
ncbi:MAG: protein phosphatase 2C domain-containing protein [Thermoproteota archaeon]